MTRHKQQLLQEQENLLEQIQKQHNGNLNTANTTPDTTDNAVGTDEGNNNNNNTTTTEQQRKAKKSPRNSPRKISISSSKSCGTKDDDVPASMVNRQHNHHITATIKTEQTDTSTLKSESYRKLSDSHPTKNTSTNHIENDGVQSPDNSGGGRLMAMLRDNPPTSSSKKQLEVISNGHCSPLSSCSPPMPSSVDIYHHYKNHNNGHPRPSSTSSHNGHLKRQHHQPFVNHNSISDQMTRPSANHTHGNSNHNLTTYAEHVEEMRKMDNSLFGRHMVSTSYPIFSKTSNIEEEISLLTREVIDVKTT